MLAITLNFHIFTLFSFQSRRSRCCGPPSPQPMAPRPWPPRRCAPLPAYMDKNNDKGLTTAARTTTSLTPSLSAASEEKAK